MNVELPFARDLRDFYATGMRSQQYAAKSIAFSEGLSKTASHAAFEMATVENSLRSLFLKGQPQPPDIGDHPDFRHLKGTNNTTYSPITTLFMDIEASTRLNLYYSPEEVYKIKNTFIRGAIGMIRAFDGHVHRIMGDAVMAYFGRVGNHDENGCIDAVNCASMLRLSSEKFFNPLLKSSGFDDDFGIRIGLDFGRKEDVLWSSYGYPGMNEVTATSFFVDVASKLQNQAGRNGIMVGGSFKSFLDFPDELLEIKTYTDRGAKIDDPFISPNYQTKEKRPLNYRKYLLNWDTYLRYSPLSAHGLNQFMGRNTLPAALVKVEVHTQKENGTYLYDYPSSGASIPKDRGIIFKVSIPFKPMLPYSVWFKVVNHGAEARVKNHQTAESHETKFLVDTDWKHNNIVHAESTAYRGLHYMTIEVETNKGTQFRNEIGVYVQ